MERELKSTQFNLLIMRFTRLMRLLCFESETLPNLWMFRHDKSIYLWDETVDISTWQFNFYKSSPQFHVQLMTHDLNVFDISAFKNINRDK